MSTYTDEQLQQLIPFVEKLAEYNPGSGYDLSKALMVEVLHLRSLLREVCEAAEHVPIWGSDGHARYVCAACEFQRVKGAELVPHAPDCPVGTAKKFLGIDQ